MTEVTMTSDVSVEVVRYQASDTFVAHAARVSTLGEHAEESDLSEALWHLEAL